MAMNSNPFTPQSTVSRAVSGSSANVALGTGSGLVLLIQNQSTNPAFFKFGDSSAVTAATTDTPILAGQSQVFTAPNDTTHVAAIGTDGTLYITRGNGS